MSEDIKEIFESYKFSADKVGDIGEYITASRLREAGMKVLRHIYIPRDDKFTEIDIIGICEYGVFVIENKNYHGRIIGGIKDNKWTCNYTNFRSSTLLNPLRQLYMHIDSMMDYIEVLDLYKKKIFPVVIFNDFAKLDIKSNCVYTLSSFMDRFNSIKSRSDKILDDTEISFIYEIFSILSNSSDEMRDLHIRLLRSR